MKLYGSGRRGREVTGRARKKTMSAPGYNRAVANPRAPSVSDLHHHVDQQAPRGKLDTIISRACSIPVEDLPQALPQNNERAFVLFCRFHNIDRSDVLILYAVA